MGGGTYSYSTDSARKLDNSRMSKERVFTKSNLDASMDVKNTIRECRDSEEHPETLPIIIALDVTGSMGSIPYQLVTKDFPEIMKHIMDAGIEHPQVCFVGIGDQYWDVAPLQAGQFETSDELLDRWLKTMWLEGGGGGNDGESYQLAWWFAAAHVSADHIEKRNKKGVLITIGDEPVCGSISKEEFQRIYGSSSKVPQMETSKILEAAKEHWDVYHINVPTYSGSRPKVKNQWTHLLGDHLVSAQDGRGGDVASLIAGIVVSSVKGSESAPVGESRQADGSTQMQHLR